MSTATYKHRKRRIMSTLEQHLQTQMVRNRKPNLIRNYEHAITIR